MELGLSSSALGRIRLERLVGGVHPQLLDVAEHVEAVALFQVVAERRHVGALAALEVVGAVSRPLVVVGEDDELCRVKLEFVLLGRLVVEGLAEALAGVALDVSSFSGPAATSRSYPITADVHALLRASSADSLPISDPATSAAEGFRPVILQCASTAGVHERGLARARTPEAAESVGSMHRTRLPGAGPCAWVSRRLRLLVGGHRRALRRRHRRLGLRGLGDRVPARRGRQVGLRPRARPAYPPGSFTRSPRELARASGTRATACTGMYNYWSFRGIDALVSSGLGGGSLIYANVFLRKDEQWFVQEDLRDGGYEHWPVTRADLDPHYDRVEAMIGLQRYPLDHEPYSKTAKTIAFAAAAEARAWSGSSPSSRSPSPTRARRRSPASAIEEELANLHGRTRYTCQLCGECDVGCNYGAKNTLDYNYLPRRRPHGAELRTLCDVRRFEPRDGGGYAVHYVEHDVADEAASRAPGPSVRPRAESPATTSCSAPARSARPTCCCKPRRLPAAEPRLGTPLLRQRRPAHARASSSERGRSSRGSRPGHHEREHVPDALDGGEGRGFYLQDAGYPELALDPAVLAAPKSLWAWRRGAAVLVKNWLRAARQPTSAATSPSSSAVARLAGRLPAAAGDGPRHPRRADVPDATALDLDWEAQARATTSPACGPTSRAVRPRAGAKFADNPTLVPAARDHRPPARRLPDGPTTPAEGVVDPYGNVFGYPGLHDRRRLDHARAGRAQPELHDRRPRRSLRRLDDRGRG